MQAHRDVRLEDGTDPDSGLSLVIPTYNERGNVIPLLMGVLQSVETLPMDVEVIVVDDNSPDGTASVIEGWLGKGFPSTQRNGSEFICHIATSGSGRHRSIRVISRPKKMGLASAVLHGFQRAQGRILGFMDGDSSHPPDAVPSMVSQILKPGGPDLVIGSRYVAGAPRPALPWRRRLASTLANWAAGSITGARDSTSGFVFFRRHIVDFDELDPTGFKLGLEIMAKGNYRAMEVPYRYCRRASGRSKLHFGAVWHFGVQVTRFFLLALVQRLQSQSPKSTMLRLLRWF